MRCFFTYVIRSHYKVTFKLVLLENGILCILKILMTKSKKLSSRTRSVKNFDLFMILFV